MVPIFVFISPTFIYSFLEEKVQSSYNYLICVDFPLYAREINTKEISSVVLACKCCLKIQPDYQPRFLIPAGFLALSTWSASWGRSIVACMVHGGNWSTRRLKIPRMRCLLLQVREPRWDWMPGAVHSAEISSPRLQYGLEHRQCRGETVSLLFRWCIKIKAKLGRVKGCGTQH